MNSTEVREKLVETLQLDLVGPYPGHAFEHELLPQSPQRWYLTGYLVPQQAPEEQRRTKDEEMVEDAATGATGDDNDVPEPQAQVSYLPSSMGMSVLIGKSTTVIDAVVRWGDYISESEDNQEIDPEQVDQEFEEEIAKESEEIDVELLLEEKGKDYGNKTKLSRRGYRREPREESVHITVDEDHGALELDIPNSRGVRVIASWRTLPDLAGSVVTGTKTLSVFVLNDRAVGGRGLTFREIAFQVELELHAKEGFIGRPDLRGLSFRNEWDADERIADLHYRDVLEFAVGHGVSVRSVEKEDGSCANVKTTWIPQAEVSRVEHADKQTIGEVELAMDRLGQLKDGDDAKHCLQQLVRSYRDWISNQEINLSSLSLSKTQTDSGKDLIVGAKLAADRIEEGITLLSDPVCLEAFRIANRAMARAARQRFGVQQGIAPHKVDAPKWRAFQIAYILMNLNGLFDPQHPGRKTVDLLFFPTGGGKTEAYLGLAAFTLVVRRLRNPGIDSAGVSIIMRYTLRLLTLDQLGRAAALMCALELERAQNNELGEWPFEIGLWVGSAATPNRMGQANDTAPGKDDTAYAKLTKYKNKPAKHPAPIPIEECPWCGSRFTPDSFRLEPAGSRVPTDLYVSCENMHCEFSSANNDARLPILGVDEPIYRRLPCFLIATVDKFAALPWTGQVGALFGKVERFDSNGFYGPCDAGRGANLPNDELLPPDLIIQDELHLISGPLGTIAGIYETAIEELCKRNVTDDLQLLPKIVASTATVRRADRQIRALFGRHDTAIFPPPGPDRNDSFFARTVPCSIDDPGRLYLGIAAQGRSMKVVFLRASLALLAGAQQLYHEAGGKQEHNPCDPYMTLLGYFNSLRELGGSRRIVEDEVYIQVQSRWKRRRRDPTDNSFRSRYIKRTPVELTSRVGTNDVSKAKRDLAFDTTEQESVDVALATNMISVGLDIVRLGLMVVLGQPKTSSEYIQATSRVGRDKARPGLVVTLLNVHKPRDRSHYERFNNYHQTFYRAVETTSVTPFSPRALDRGLAAALVGLCRHWKPDIEPPSLAGNVGSFLPVLQQLVQCFAKRALIHDGYMESDRASELETHVDNLAQDLLSKWHQIAANCAREGGTLSYQKYEGPRQGDALIRDFLDADYQTLPDIYRSFRANRSMRDVEAPVDIHPEKSSIGTNQ